MSVRAANVLDLPSRWVITKWVVRDQTTGDEYVFPAWQVALRVAVERGSCEVLPRRYRRVGSRYVEVD